MKKLLVSLLALSVLSIGMSASAASKFSKWLDNTAAKVNKAEASYEKAKTDAAAAKKQQKEAAEAQKAQAKATKEAAKKRVNEEKSFWKSLFSKD